MPACTLHRPFSIWGWFFLFNYCVIYVQVQGRLPFLRQVSSFSESFFLLLLGYFLLIPLPMGQKISICGSKPLFQLRKICCPALIFLHGQAQYHFCQSVLRYAAQNISKPILVKKLAYFLSCRYNIYHKAFLFLLVVLWLLSPHILPLPRENCLCLFFRFAHLEFIV